MGAPNTPPGAPGVSFSSTKSGLAVPGRGNLQASDLFVGGKSLRRRPGVAVMPVTTSTAAGGWNLNSCTIAISPLTTHLSQTTGQMLRITGSNGSGGDSFAVIRRKVAPDTLLSCAGKIEFPAFVPFNLAANATIEVRVTSDTPAADPPNVTATNIAKYKWEPSQMKRGQIQMFGIDFNCTSATQPNLNDGGGIVLTGTVDYTQIKEIDIFCYIPAGTAGNDHYIDIGDITAGAKSTPHVMIGFDGAGSDISHYALAAAIMERHNLKGCFSPQGQIIPSYLTHLIRMYAAGHDIVNEGRNHTNYASSPTNLVADFLSTAATLVAAGMSRGAYVFAAPQNTLNAVGSASPGISDLYANGAIYIRTGNRWNFPTPAGGNEPMNNGAFNGDLKTAAQMEAFLDDLELHGESGELLFHNLFDNTTSGTASGNQTNVTEFTMFCAKLATRIASGRIINCTQSEFVRAVNS